VRRLCAHDSHPMSDSRGKNFSPPLRPPQYEHPTPFRERQAGDRRSHCQIRNRGALVENAIVLKSWRLARPPTWSTGLASCANTRIVVHMRYLHFGTTCSERPATHRNSSSSLRFTGLMNWIGTACRKSRMSAVRVTARLLRLIGGSSALSNLPVSVPIHKYKFGDRPSAADAIDPARLQLELQSFLLSVAIAFDYSVNDAGTIAPAPKEDCMRICVQPGWTLRRSRSSSGDRAASHSCRRR
jgi:hypothetical protein